LPLDGGHIAGAIYEAIKKAVWRLRGKPNPGPADTALMMPLTYVVSGLLIVLSLILLLVDLINPVSLGL
jgi:membrane-associated protease RseP (regulator of RpoE activity)